MALEVAEEVEVTHWTCPAAILSEEADLVGLTTLSCDLLFDLAYLMHASVGRSSPKQGRPFYITL